MALAITSIQWQRILGALQPKLFTNKQIKEVLLAIGELQKTENNECNHYNRNCWLTCIWKDVVMKTTAMWELLQRRENGRCN